MVLLAMAKLVGATSEAAKAMAIVSRSKTRGVAVTEVGSRFIRPWIRTGLDLGWSRTQPA
jgi:hypothetical protein